METLILFVWGMAYADKRSAAPPIEAMGPPSEVRSGHTHALPESTFPQPTLLTFVLVLAVQVVVGEARVFEREAAVMFFVFTRECLDDFAW